MKVNQVVILAGGLGTRLGKITKKIPKPMIRINKKTFIEHLIKNFSRYGIKKVLILTSYKSKIFFKNYNNKKLFNVMVTCHNEDDLKGTGGALLDAKKKIEKYFYLCNGDTFFDVNYLNFINSLNKKNLISVGICRVKNKTRFSGIAIHKDKISKFDATNSNYVNAGYYLVNKKIFSILKSNIKKFSFENYLIPKIISKKKATFTFFDKSNFLDIGVKKDLLKASIFLKNKENKKAIFLDRDGVINFDSGYVHKIKNFYWLPKIIQSIKYFNDNNYYVFVVSNQSGVGRAYYREKDVVLLEKYIQDELIKNGAHIDEFQYSFYFKNSTIKKYRMNSSLRKPNIGMFNKLKKKWSFDPKKSFMIGDQLTDINFGKKSGLKTFDINNYYSVMDIIKKNFL